MNTKCNSTHRANFGFTPLAAALALCLSGTASAATLKVNTAIASGAAGKCTLSDAVSAINRGAISRLNNCTNTGPAFGAGDTIVFQDHFTINFNMPAEGSSSALVLKKPVTISGSVSSSGQPLVTIARSAKSAGQFRLIESTADLVLTGVALSGGSVTGDGGGVRVSGGASLQLLDAAVVGNSATGRGGGIYVEDSMLDLDASTVSGNSAAVAGGGVYSYIGVATLSNSTVSGNDGGQLGGGLAVGAVYSDTSTFSGNSAAVGGGIYTLMPSRLTNTTVSGNSASTSGGGVYSSGTITMTFSTISANSVGFGGSGAGVVVFFDGNSSTATIVSGNIGGADVDSSYQSSLGGDHNLVGTMGANLRLPADTLHCNPQLAPLMNAGGPTLTQPLMLQSCAVNAGPATTSIVSDQRGMPRMVGTSTDIGADEKQSQ